VRICVHNDNGVYFFYIFNLFFFSWSKSDFCDFDHNGQNHCEGGGNLEVFKNNLSKAASGMKVRTLLALVCVVACTGATNDTMPAFTDGSCAAQQRTIHVRVEAWRAARLLRNWREMHGFADVETWPEQAWRSAPAECIQDPLLDHPPAGCINGYLYDGLREEALRNASAVCSKLAERSIKNISVLGDSFMRQLHAGTLSLLLSNARNGALAQVYVCRAPLVPPDSDQ